MTQQMKLKIVSDGTTAGTYVCHAITGERLAGVQLLSWSASTDQSQTEATLHLWGVPCEISSDVGMILNGGLPDEPAFPVLPKEYQTSTDDTLVIDITELLKRQQ